MTLSVAWAKMPALPATVRAEVASAVRAIAALIKEAEITQKTLVSFDLAGNMPRIASEGIQGMLIGKGYVVMVAHGHDAGHEPPSERLYIDLSRRWTATNPEQPKGEKPDDSES